MKKTRLHVIVLMSCMLLDVYGLQEWQFPRSGDPQEFGKQIERLVSTSAERGIGVGGPERQEQESAIREDSRNWEVVLAEIIGNPEKVGLQQARIAFSIARIRSSATRPEIVTALITLFHAHVDDALKSIAKAHESGGEVPYHATVQFEAFTEDILEVGDPEILQVVLKHLNSEDDREIAQIDGFAPKYVASALEKYGGEANVEEAEKLVVRLKEKGRNDVAADIASSLKRIEGSGHVPASLASGQDSKVVPATGGSGVSMFRYPVPVIGALALFGMIVVIWSFRGKPGVSKRRS